jgi:hypothetical protein
MPIFLHRRLSQLTCKYDRQAINFTKKGPGEALPAPPGATKSIIALGLEFADSSGIGQGHLFPSQFSRMSLNYDFHLAIQTGRHCTPGCVLMEIFLSAPLVNGRAYR